MNDRGLIVARPSVSVRVAFSGIRVAPLAENA
jgi:hypothetical protein